MSEEKFEKFVDNLLIFYPLFYRKIKTSMNDEKSLKYGKTDGYYQILGILLDWGPSPISKIGRELFISKSNMTPLIDKLVEDRMVKRVRSEKDRRIVNVEITAEGREFMRGARKVVEENIKSNLQNLDEKELETLYESLENIRKIVFKINHQ